MTAFEVVVLTPTHRDWPSQFTTRLGSAAPASLATMGNISLLAKRTKPIRSHLTNRADYPSHSSILGLTTSRFPAITVLHIDLHANVHAASRHFCL